MAQKNMTSQEAARKQVHLILADAAHRLGLEPVKQTLMSILYLLQESYGLPTSYSFSFHLNGPQARLWKGTLPRTALAAQEAKPPVHDFQDHVTRMLQDMDGAGSSTLTRYSTLVFANRRRNLDSLQQAISFIQEIQPQGTPEATIEAWIFLSRRGLVRTQEQKMEIRRLQ